MKVAGYRSALYR